MIVSLLQLVQTVNYIIYKITDSQAALTVRTYYQIKGSSFGETHIFVLFVISVLFFQRSILSLLRNEYM